MHARVITVIVSLLAVWPTMTAAGELHAQGEPPAAQASALTEDQIKQAQEALKNGE
jgi:hypothetical protein